MSTPSLPLPTSLAGVTVTISGVAAPLFAVADLGGYQQIDFQVPVKAVVYVEGTPVVVSQNGLEGSATPDLSNSPGEFFRIGATQFGIFQHSSDYSQVTVDNPAAAGETIIAYLTGLPVAISPVPDGQATPVGPLYFVPQTNLSLAGPLDQLGLFIGENPGGNDAAHLYDKPPIHGDSTGLSPIPFIGLAPGMVGVYQINFILPDSAPSGIIPVQVVRDQCVVFIPVLPDCFPEFYPNGGQDLEFSEPVPLPVR